MIGQRFTPEGWRWLATPAFATHRRSDPFTAIQACLGKPENRTSAQVDISPDPANSAGCANWPRLPVEEIADARFTSEPLTHTVEKNDMNECEELISQLHADAGKHVQLAMIARAPAVTAMHIDLALFSKDQSRIAEELCQAE